MTWLQFTLIARVALLAAVAVALKVAADEWFAGAGQVADELAPAAVERAPGNTESVAFAAAIAGASVHGTVAAEDWSSSAADIGAAVAAAAALYLVVVGTAATVVGAACEGGVVDRPELDWDSVSPLHFKKTITPLD